MAMIRSFRRKLFASSILGLGLSGSVSLAASPYAANHPAAATEKIAEEGKDEQTVIVREKNRPDRECVVVVMKTVEDGTRFFQLKAKDNGEEIWLRQRPNSAAVRISTADMKRYNNDHAAKGDSKPTPAEMEKQQASAGQQTASSVIKPPPADELPLIPQDDEKAKVDPVPSAFGKPMPAGPASETFNGRTRNASDMSRSFESVIKPPAAEVSEKARPGKTETTAPSSNQEPPKLKLDKAKSVARTGVAKVDVPGRSLINEPAAMPAPLNFAGQPGVPPMLMQTNAPGQQPTTEAQKFAECKQNLHGALRPSQRMLAVEDMLTLAAGRLDEVRGLLMAAAQDDPAACVRAACIHALARLRTHSDAYLSLLDVAQDDEDEEVRDVAAYALKRLAKK